MIKIKKNMKIKININIKIKIKLKEQNGDEHNTDDENAKVWAAEPRRRVARRTRGHAAERVLRTRRPDDLQSGGPATLGARAEGIARTPRSRSLIYLIYLVSLLVC